VLGYIQTFFGRRMAKFEKGVIYIVFVEMGEIEPSMKTVSDVFESTLIYNN
jgi:hypothetical protein